MSDPLSWQTNHQMADRVKSLAVMLAVTLCLGCSNESTNTISFKDLPKDETAIADASDVAIENGGETQESDGSPEIASPPSFEDPFADDDTQTNADIRKSTPGDSLNVNSVVATADSDDAQTSNEAKDPEDNATVVQPVAQSKPAPDEQQLTPLERMLRKRAAAIAKANGEEAPTFDDDSEDTGPREIELLVPEKTFRKVGSSDVIRISFDDLDLLKVLNMAPVPTDAAKHFPEWMKQLHGKKVRVRGFMYPTMMDEGITKFRIARDNDICCFIKKPKIYDTARVDMKKGVTTRYLEGFPFDVVGTFRINPRAEFGELFELWRIEEATIVRR